MDYEYSTIFPHITIIENEGAIGSIIDLLDDLFAPDGKFQYICKKDIFNALDTKYKNIDIEFPNLYIIYVYGHKPSKTKIRKIVYNSGFIGEEDFDGI